MESKALIFVKLELFIKKFYKNELIKGALFFVSLGLIYLILTLLLEHFLWLKPLYRTILFYFFVVVELFLLLRFIFFPIFQLFKLKKGINYTDASLIIGRHFPEVEDKLLNFLQLNTLSSNEALVLASIDQRANDLKLIPFTDAVTYRDNRKWIPLALIPILFVLFFFISGNGAVITDSFSRVVRHQEYFQPPAPFRFQILNQDLQVEQGQDFILKVKTIGSKVPENLSIVMGDETYFLSAVGPSDFEFKFQNVSQITRFYFEANNLVSDVYELKVIHVPTIIDFEMELVFPSHIRRSKEIIKGSGSTLIPEGTLVTWKINTLETTEVSFFSNKVEQKFTQDGNVFTIKKNVMQTTFYEIKTGNQNISDYQILPFELTVVKDQFPSISVDLAPIEVSKGETVYVGQVLDDYGLTHLQMVYYPIENPSQISKKSIAVKKDVLDQFAISFPGDLPLQEGLVYDYYFEIFDNDVVNHFKSTKTSVFRSSVLTENQKEDLLLQDKNANINSLQKSLKSQEKQLSELDQLQKKAKESNELNFKEQQKVIDFIQKQKNQESLMKSFQDKLHDNLKQFKTDQNDEKKENLLDRLEKNSKETDENQKLLDELEKLANKLQDEELFEKADAFKKSSKNQKRNLEQLVELTKRYYVEKKLEQLLDKLEKLADQQDKLSESLQNSKSKQADLNQEFETFKEQLDALQKDNKELKKPLDIPQDKSTEESISKDMNASKEDLENDQKESAKSKQKKASKKMKQLAQSMSASMASGEQEQMEEDIQQLRQILDNLLSFSFEQELVMKDFRSLKRGSPSFTKHIKRQQDLKVQFKHIDDSLFSLAMRNSFMTEKVTLEIGEVYYNTDKSLELLADNSIYKGVSHQQYTVSAANRLADLLSEIMNNMQMSLNSSGSGGKPKPGQGKGNQLPDIIMKQQGLSEKMKKGIKSKTKDGEEGEDGEDGKQGQSGKDGKEGKDGKQGKDSGDGEASGDGETNAKLLLEIFNEQRKLREQLLDQLSKQGLTPDGKKVLDQMKDIEKDVLNKGFKNDVLKKMLEIRYNLLKLENTLLEQEEDTKRQSNTNKKEYDPSNETLNPAIKQYLNSIEILNRQVLPLQPNFNQRVKHYFKEHD